MTTPTATDINELFARDPKTHSDSDIESMIAYFRSARATFHLGNAQAGSKSASKAKKKPVIDLDLSDII